MKGALCAKAVTVGASSRCFKSLMGTDYITF